jgi:branched-chain amino acid transport system substrate-binding protein
MNKKVTWSIIGVVAVIIAIILLVSGQNTSHSNGPIKIGAPFILSGDAAAWGQNAKEGIDLAVGKYNASHPNRPVQVIYEDTQGDSKQAVTAFTKLVTIDHVNAIIGPLFQNELAAVDPLIEQDHIPVIAPSYLSPQDRTNLHNPLLIWIDAYVEADRIATYVASQGVKTVGIVGTQDPWETLVSNEFAQKAKQLGMKVVDEEIAPTDASDMRLQVTRLLGSHPDAVFIGSYYQFVNTLKQLSQLKYTGNIYGIEVDSSLADQTKGYVPDIKFIAPDFYTSDFVTLFKNTYNKEPGIPAGQAYDAASLLLSDIASSSNPSDILQDFETRTSYDGISGHISFTPQGQTIMPTGLFDIKDGVITRVSSLQ